MTPDTWDNVRIGGAKLKAKGHPVGFRSATATTRICAGAACCGVMAAPAGRKREEGRARQQGDGRSGQIRHCSLQGGDDGDVLSWDDASNNKYIDSGVGSFIINPISAYRTAQQLNEKFADDIFVMKTPKGPVRQLVGAASNSMGSGNSPRTRIRRSSFSNTMPITGSTRSRRAPATICRSTRIIVPKPMPILSNDPTSHPPDKLAILQTSDEWCAVAGYPGPAWAATDEVYNNFILCDMMTKAATGAMTPEESVKWAAHECELIFKKWAKPDRGARAVPQGVLARLGCGKSRAPPGGAFGGISRGGFWEVRWLRY